MCGGRNTMLLTDSYETEGWTGAPAYWEEWHCSPCDFPFTLSGPELEVGRGPQPWLWDSDSDSAPGPEAPRV